MLKLGYGIWHDDIGDTTSQCLCSPWSQHVDDATPSRMFAYTPRVERSYLSGTRFSRQGINSNLVPVLRVTIKTETVDRPVFVLK